MSWDLIMELNILSFHEMLLFALYQKSVNCAQVLIAIARRFWISAAWFTVSVRRVPQCCHFCSSSQWWLLFLRRVREADLILVLQLRHLPPNPVSRFEVFLSAIEGVGTEFLIFWVFGGQMQRKKSNMDLCEQKRKTELRLERGKIFHTPYEQN